MPAIPKVGLRALDVRPILDSGQDPLETILTTLDEVMEPGVLELIVPFLPKPLLTLLEKKRIGTEVRAFEGLYLVQVSRGEAPVTDLVDLEAPEPMIQVLTRAEALAPGRAFIARLPRMPHPLLVQLRTRKFSFETLESPDGSALVRVWRSP